MSDVQRIEAACEALGGAQAIYSRLDAASDEEAHAWLAARSPDEREAIMVLLSFRLPHPSLDEDLAALAKLDERMVYAKLKTATPTLRARFAEYLQRVELCRTPDHILGVLERFDDPPPAASSVPDSV